MRRLWTVSLLALLAVGAVLAVRPHLLASAADRAIRVMAYALPETAARLRQHGGRPLAERLAERGLALGAPAFVRIFKEESQLELWLERAGTFELFETYPICSWSGELGPKLKEGDGQSPEGFYAVGLKQLNPRSAYYLSFDLGFPNAYDRAHGRTGSFLMVHGDCLSIGCYAIRDSGIDDVYRIVEASLRKGQHQVPVQALPFRLTDEKLATRREHRWAAEWRAFKRGYDLFEQTRIPPDVAVCGGSYTFGGSPAAPCEPIKAL